MTWFYHGDNAGDWLTFDVARSNPPFTGGGDEVYERTQNGTTYLISGNRRYEVTERGNLRWVGDVAPAPSPSWLRRLWAWVRSWL